MLEVVNRFICGLITSFAGYLVIRKVFVTDHKFKFKDLFYMAFYALFLTLNYKVEYSPIAPLINYLFSIFAYKFIFGFDYVKAIVVAASVMLLLFVSEVFWAFNTVLTSDFFRNNSFLATYCCCDRKYPLYNLS